MFFSVNYLFIYLIFSGVPSEEGAAGVQRGEGQRSAGEGPPQQPPQALGGRAGVGEEHAHRPQPGDPSPGGEASRVKGHDCVTATKSGLHGRLHDQKWLSRV